jgi:glycerol uptake facilitator protein/aquaporin Z
MAGIAWRRVALEGVLTASLMFGVITIAVAGAWRGGSLRLDMLAEGAAAGLLVGGLVAAGGHMNPSITIGMWGFGQMRCRDVLPFIAAQMAGSLLGIRAGAVAWGGAVAHPPMSYAAVRPEAGWAAGQVFVAEAGGMAIILVLVGVSLHRAPKCIPLLVGVLIGTAIATTGTVEGASLNPARAFGPAILSGQARYLWAYLAGPVAGAVLAVAARGAAGLAGARLSRRAGRRGAARAARPGQAELTRLLQENDALRAELVASRSDGRVPMPAPAARGPEGHLDLDTAAHVLALAQQTADQMNAEARHEVDQALSEADAILSKARRQAEQVTSDARARVENLERDARARQRQCTPPGHTP